MLADVTPFDIVVFGAGGDLTQRKLLPALFQRELSEQLPADGRIIGVNRLALNTPEFVTATRESLLTCNDGAPLEPHAASRFLERLHYVNVESDAGYAELARLLADREDRTRVFYLATPPDQFGPVCRMLAAHGLATPSSRVVLEKPLGHDLASAVRINAEVASVFEEGQIFRIDHYLGKEGVQNLLVLRFGNALFESLWSQAHVDHVQITVAESLGVEQRGGYYDRAGALRDMVQNHLLQVLCIVAMEPPVSLRPDAVRDEKLKVLEALRPIEGHQVDRQTVRGQYGSGAISGRPVPGYLEEASVKPGSNTETFVALKTEVRNWRWAGVPFYLRTGKRLARRASEIVVQFKDAPHCIFEGHPGALSANQLIIRLQPDDGIQLRMMAKNPGPGMILRPVHLNLSFAETFRARQPDAYERLLIDVLKGRPTLFMRRDELEASWRFVEPIAERWAQSSEAPKPYAAGTWGPTSSVALIERDERTWNETTP
jgi:glucose-6-phosphate 1-dehydrogenase